MECKGVVFGEVVSGVNFIKDFAASIRNIIGGRSGSYENELVEARSSNRREYCNLDYSVKPVFEYPVCFIYFIQSESV